VPLSEFILSGGSAKCLSLRLDEPAPPPRITTRPDLRSRVVTMEGHLLDSGVMARAYNIISEAGATFDMHEFRVGQRREHKTFVRMAVSALDDALLDEVLTQLMELGAQVEDDDQRPARLVVVEKDGVAPEDFYTTTIYPTDVLVDARWVRATHQRMDGMLVITRLPDGPRARVTIMRDLRQGDLVVTGADGIRVLPKTAIQEDPSEFKFMSAGVSSERRVEIVVDQIAWEMNQIKNRNGKIVLVPGPVCVHTGGVQYLSELIRRGYADALLTGNALAVHDIERALFGTSLGVDLQRGVTVHGGHRHHLAAINTVRRAGSIASAVAQGILREGVMYEAVRAGIPFCLAGSIRDDGPLPDTEMDLVKAQARYAEILQGAEMVIMLSSMLHSIGVGNMTPAGVRLVCVDINPAVATKLSDRGSVESTPVVTDVGLFLNLLVRKLADLQMEAPVHA
jgi:lysine-ketoglutarate reductase/saccharopine dehydrogenase-like protein (TIGR00300 family)